MNGPFTAERDAELFVAVVDNGGITAAAAALRIAQPSLSQAIRTLETRAGVDLFERTPRGAVPTAAGRALVDPARRVLAGAAAARQAVCDVVAVRAGTLRLAAHAAVVAQPLAGAIGRFRRRHPGVLVHVGDVPDDAELPAVIAGGQAELAVVSLPLSMDTGLVVTRLGTYELLAAFPPGSLDPGEPLPRAVLRELSLVAAPYAAPGRRTVGLGAPAELDTGVVTARPGAVVPLVLAGAGVALVDSWYARRIIALGGVVRPLDPPVRVPYGVAHGTAPLSPAATAFLALLRATL